ncbi:hypothetical protein [Photobacterium leiognathi]|uniref:hypothetical protein n=1 Tax=Photobacterium leiognathi TaxID=553611 RepID=UPI0029820AFB|nr:hypothetical protein [Photobacterium leiognathi]
MKKILGVVLAASLVSGCQLMGGGANSSDITNADFKNMGCDEIKSVFETYQESMEMAETGSNLLSIVDLDAGLGEAQEIASQAYNQAATVARPVVKLKKCDFTI